MDDIRVLEKDFCPPIDSSLFSAIVSDYDLSDTASRDELRNTLEIVKASALEQEAIQFDASGTSGVQDAESSHGSSERARSWHGDVASSTTDDTEISGLGQALENVGIHGHCTSEPVFGFDDARRDSHLEALPAEEKIQLLKEMFPATKDIDITHTFKKSGNVFEKTVEELLNYAFLDEGGHRKKGIEAFTEPSISGRGRRRRKKQNQLFRRTSSTPRSTDNKPFDSLSPLSRWDRGKEDIDFIAQRTFLSPSVIASTYHKNGASLASTIAVLCASIDTETVTNPYISDSAEPLLELHAAELSVDFQRLPYLQLQALIKLTHPSTGSAHELARALTSQATSAAIIPQYLPRPHSPEDLISRSTLFNTALPPATAAALATTRINAFDQASSAYRKSRSKPLMGGAASYYSSVARDASTSLRSHEAAEANALVNNQSRSGEVDLHGVNVKDAVSIARNRVESWWDKEGRERARQGKVMGGGLRVITGVGRHSEGGRGKLGPAVGKMLHGEGWKVEIGDGVIEVVGRQRR